MLTYANGLFRATLKTYFERIPEFMTAQIANRFKRFHLCPMLILEDNGNLVVVIAIPENATTYEEVKQELEEIIRLWEVKK